ncbi:hypothetical protein H8D85_02495 [bacterium]|nr:hypothetical protein [bacterium]
MIYNLYTKKGDYVYSYYATSQEEAELFFMELKRMPRKTFNRLFIVKERNRKDDTK